MEEIITTYKPLDAVTFRQAAIEILKAAGKQMHYTEITKEAIKEGYWRPQDEEFIKQHMYQAIKADLRKKRYGSVFVEVAPGTYEINRLVVKE
ncbi:MAG: winged helix-turn-helix domain-containing protein [Chitinophagaceae bacterium]|nr:winged helix-turn-helix domain-containing protein [Chitinophagaceae bacterium]